MGSWTPDCRKKEIFFFFFEMDMNKNQVILRLPVDMKANMWRRPA